MTIKIVLIYISAGILLASCTTTEGNEIIPDVKLPDVDNEKIIVEAIKVEKQNFYKEIKCNGKISARRKAELQFEVKGKLNNIYVTNGEKINKGQPIARLDSFILRNKLDHKQISLQNARLQLSDILLGQGYNHKDTTNIPKEIMDMANIRSGLLQAEAEYRLALYNIKMSVLKAPFSGVIAGLEAEEYNNISPSGVFCTLIDDSGFEATFSILENEIDEISKGMQVTVFPFSVDTIDYRGKISEINPMVDDNGQVKVTALIYDNPNRLIDGMNANIVIQIAIPNQIIIPKEAVIIRSGKQVVFTYQGGFAKWNYINTGYENSNSYTVENGLSDGDMVIVNGNMNLGHDAEVELVNSEK